MNISKEDYIQGRINQIKDSDMDRMKEFFISLEYDFEAIKSLKKEKEIIDSVIQKTKEVSNDIKPKDIEYKIFKT